MRLSSFIKLLSEKFEPNLEVNCDVIIDVESKKISFPERVVKEPVILSTLQCQKCDFIFEHLKFEPNVSDCPSCFTKKLIVLEQRFIQ